MVPIEVSHHGGPDAQNTVTVEHVLDRSLELDGSLAQENIGFECRSTGGIHIYHIEFCVVIKVSENKRTLCSRDWESRILLESHTGRGYASWEERDIGSFVVAV